MERKRDERGAEERGSAKGSRQGWQCPNGDGHREERHTVVVVAAHRDDDQAGEQRDGEDLIGRPRGPRGPGHEPNRRRAQSRRQGVHHRWRVEERRWVELGLVPPQVREQTGDALVGRDRDPRRSGLSLGGLEPHPPGPDRYPGSSRQHDRQDQTPEDRQGLPHPPDQQDQQDQHAARLDQGQGRQGRGQGNGAIAPELDPHPGGEAQRQDVRLSQREVLVNRMGEEERGRHQRRDGLLQLQLPDGQRNDPEQDQRIEDRPSDPGIFQRQRGERQEERAGGRGARRPDVVDLRRIPRRLAREPGVIVVPGRIDPRREELGACIERGEAVGRADRSVCGRDEKVSEGRQADSPGRRSDSVGHGSGYRQGKRKGKSNFGSGPQIGHTASAMRVPSLSATFSNALVKLNERTHRTFALPILMYAPTSRCNSHCVSCDWWRTDGASDLSVAEVEALAAALPRLGTKLVVFTGGEPLVRSDVFQLADLFLAQGVHLHLLTSGLALEKLAGEVAPRFESVTISLDGDTPELYRRVRGVDGLAAVERGIRRIKQLRPGLPVRARSTLHRLNYTAVPQLIDKAMSMGLDQILVPQRRCELRLVRSATQRDSRRLRLLVAERRSGPRVRAGHRRGHSEPRGGLSTEPGRREGRSPSPPRLVLPGSA